MSELLFNGKYTKRFVYRLAKFSFEKNISIVSYLNKFYSK